jgi:hypothetical protein
VKFPTTSCFIDTSGFPFYSHSRIYISTRAEFHAQHKFIKSESML